MKDGLSLTAGTTLSLQAFSQSFSENKKTGVSRTSLKSLTAIPTTCRQCPAGCGIIAYLNGDRLVQILGNPDHPNNMGGICAKGIGGINQVNDPERLLYPLKRIGPRGQNNWTRITWDEVYLTLASRIGRSIKEGRIKEMIFDLGQTDPLLLKFIRALGAPEVINRAYLKGLNRSSAFAAMTGHESFIPDVAKSRIILNFGANPFANHEHFVGIARRIIQARTERGTRLITFDVRLSETAAKSDEWYPVKPGTDGGVALAMAHVIVNQGLADRTFLEQKANISQDDLKKHLSPFTPEWAEKECGIAARDIERLAILFASNKPSVAIIGGGAYDHANGNQNTRCISLVNWVTGNLEKEGGLFSPRYPMEPTAFANSAGTISDPKRKKTPIDTYFAYAANPAYADAECDKSAALLKDDETIRFLVVMDTHMTESAMLADMVLPAATYLEGWGAEPAPSLDGFPILNLRQPVVSLVSPAKALRSPSFDAGKLLESTFTPLGEAKEVGNFCLKLAEYLGNDIATKLPFKDTYDYTLQTVESVYNGRVDMRTLKQRGLWVEEETQRKTERTSLSITQDARKNQERSPLPGYIPLRAYQNKNPDQFILTPFKPNLGTAGMENSKWAREIFHENRLWMNKQKADELGIKNGEKIRVTSSAGSLTVRVLTTHRIHPESVAIAEGLGHTAFGSAAQARKTRSKDPDTRLIWWGKKGKGVNPYSIIENRVDPVGRGPASKDTVVRVEKIED